MAFDEAGSITPESLHNFIAAMPEAQRSDMLTPDGRPAHQAVDRLMSATFRHAYDSDALVQLYAQAADLMGQLKDAGQFDMRHAVTKAAHMAVNAVRQGCKLSDVVKNQDVDTTADAFAVTTSWHRTFAVRAKWPKACETGQALHYSSARFSRKMKNRQGCLAPSRYWPGRKSWPN